MLINKTCEKLCKQSLTEDDIDNFIWMIERDYKIYWYQFLKEKLFNKRMHILYNRYF